ncbi:MAG: MGMT family protein [Balneolaceae bacterium]
MSTPEAHPITTPTPVFPGLEMIWVHPSNIRTHPEPIRWSVETTPAGELLILESGDGLISATFTESAQRDLERWKETHPGQTLIPQVTSWISTEDNHDSVPPTPIRISLSGTPFQLDVWRTLLEIPWGETRTYGWIAERIGRPKACRAVGSAVGNNPIALLVPCHRVLPSTGHAGNYAGGQHRKIALLTWEGYENFKSAGAS